MSASQWLPTPVNHPRNLLSVSPASLPGAGDNVYFLENASAHSQFHPSGGGGGSGSADGVLQTLSLDIQTGSATLGRLTEILSNGAGVTTAQSTLDLHPSLDDFSNLQSSIALQTGINNGLFTSHAGQIAALQSEIAALSARVQNLEANALTFKFENGAIVPVSQLQLKTGHFPGSAYYPNSAVLKIQLSEPSDADPY